MSELGIDTSAPADSALPVGAETEAPDPAEVMRSIAAEGGWSPKEKWKGDPEAWRDAPDFLRKTNGALKASRKQIDAVTRMAATQVERIQAQAMADAEAKIAAAAEAGDADLAREGAADLKRAHAKPDPEVVSFAAKHPWFDPQTGDSEARAVALAAAEKSFKLGGSAADQVAAAEQATRKRFPELFEDGDAPEAEIARRQPPAVQGGQRSATGAPRERGVAELPAGVRAAYTPKFLKSFNLTMAEAAAAYWKENP